MSLDQRDWPPLEQLAEMEPEDVGEILFASMKKLGSQFHLRNIILGAQQPAHYASGAPQLTPQVRVNLALALSEGFDCLVRVGLITQGEQDGGWFVLSRRGRVLDPGGYRDFLQGLRLPTDLLHPLIRNIVAKAFARGEPDVAVFQAFKRVEIEVREVAGLPADLLGVALMRRAFQPDLTKNPGPLADAAVESGERQARMDLFAGAIGSYKNPQSHRHVDLDDPAEAIEQVMLASHLLRIVDERRRA